MVGMTGVVEPDEGKQEEPRREAERSRQRREADGGEQHIHPRLHEESHRHAEQRPEGRAPPRPVEDRRQGDRRQHGAEAVEPGGDVGPRGAEEEGEGEPRGRAGRGPQSCPPRGGEQPGEEEEPRTPRIDEEDLRDAPEPPDRELREAPLPGRDDGRRKRRIGHPVVRQAGERAGGEEEEPCAKDEGEGERVDPPRGQSPVEPGADPGREGGAKQQRQPHPPRVAHEGGEGAADQHAVEAPKALVALAAGQAEEPSGRRRDDQSRQRAPEDDVRAVLPGAPADAGQKEEARPGVVLEHHLPGAAQQDPQQAGGSLRSKKRCIHIRVFLVAKIGDRRHISAGRRGFSRPGAGAGSGT